MIRCNIKRENNKSTFSIDGKPSSKKGVIDLCKSLTIQIDNLCQFLPQDKVVEFAGMTPVQLLQSTQRAVAPQEMVDMHEELKDFRGKQKALQARNQGDLDALENLEGRQRRQADDVQRMRDREVIQQRVKYLEATRPFARYRQARKQHTEAKARRKEADQELRTLTAEVEPTLRAVNAKQAYQNQIELAVNERKKMVQGAERAADGIDQQLRALHERKGELEAEVEAEKAGGKKTRSEVARLDGNIARLKKQIETQPSDLDVSGYNERIRRLQRSVDDSTQRIRDLQEHQKEITYQGREKTERVRQNESDLAKLESQAGQQENKLAQVSRDTARAWDWIKQHQDEFEKQVFGPPVVECSVTDLKYVDQIETLFQRNHLLTITCQTKNDFKKLGDIVHDHLKFSEVNMQHMEGTLEDFRSPISREDLGQYGLEGWALDYMTGPEPVLAMLCSVVRLQSTGIADRDTPPQMFERLQNSPIESWVTRKSAYRITRRREYGPGATSTNVRDVRKAQIWTNKPVDTGAKRELQNNIREWEEQIRKLQQQIDDAQAEIVQARDRIRETQDEVKTLQVEKAAKQKALAEIKALPTKLAQEEDKLATAQQNISEIRQRLQAIANKQDEVTKERVRAALGLTDAVETLQKRHFDLHEAEVMLIEAKSDVEALIEKNTSVKQMLEAKQQEHDRLAQETKRIHEEATRALKETQEVVKNGDAALQEFLSTVSPDQTSQELEDEIESEKARLELMHEGNDRNVIREYEAREKRISALKASLDDYKHALDELEDRITETRKVWEPELDRLVKLISTSFSENMKEIGCAGEVGVAKEEDFEEWSIRILVKFRYAVPLFPVFPHLTLAASMSR